MEPGPFRTKTKRKGRKDGPKRSADSTEIPHRKCYRPTAGDKTYIMNGQRQLQCQQDPSDMTRVSSLKELGQIEREVLAVIFACIWFNTYLQGREFTVESNHKPLEMIHLKSMHNVPPCLQRMLLQLQKYDMTIKYKPGSEMFLADALSRCPARANQEIKLDL